MFEAPQLYRESKRSGGDAAPESDEAVAMPRKFTYIQQHDEHSGSPRFSPPAPILDWTSGLGCRVSQKQEKHKKNPAAGWVF